MLISELNQAQRLELKQQLLIEKLDEQDEQPSYKQLSAADDLITNDELMARFGGFTFTADDFNN